MIRSAFRMMVAVAAVMAASDGFAKSLLPKKQSLGAKAAIANSPVAGQKAPEVGDDGKLANLNFNQAPLDLVLETYGKMVGKTVLKDPAAPSPTITLKSEPGQNLTKEDQVEAIEVILEMNSVHLEPYGEKFVKALPRGKVRKEGIPLLNIDKDKLDESGKVVSMMIPFKNISTEEAQKALEGFKSDTGILLVFERTNSILVTDTQQNIKRMMEIARAIDIATPVTESVFVRQIKNASATDIKTVLQGFVDDAKALLEKDGQKQNKTAANNSAPSNRLLGRNQPQPQTVNNASLIMNVSDADRGMIRGNVLIVADERSNKLIIKSEKSNMDFFDKVIEALDVETVPDTVVKVYRLKYAEAEEVSDMINDLIGNSSSSSSSSKGSQNQNSKAGTGGKLTGSKTAATPAKPANQRTGEAKAGELSKDNTTVLADKRINGLVVMTNKELVPVVEQIIESMDVKLSQVLIETAIIEVGLGNSVKTGMDWVKGLNKNSDSTRYQGALGGGGGSAQAVAQSTNAANALIDGVSTVLPSIFSPGAGGLTYAVFSKSLDLAAVISLSQSDSTSKYIASPIIMTVDNKEATIEATKAYKFLSNYQTSSSYYGSTPAPQYENKDIGIKIKTTPKINPNGTVMLEVEEEYSQVGAKQEILDPYSNPVQIDTALTRKMAADVLLENQQTVVLGGLTDTLTETAETGIPILKDIPYIGKYLFGKTENTESRSELLVFMTPYVLDDAESAQAEALRRKKALSDSRPWEDHGWSTSALADPVSKKEQLRRLKDEWKKQDAERKSKLAIEQEKIKRAKALEEMSKEERDYWLEQHKEELEEEQQDELEKKMLDDESQEELRKIATAAKEKLIKASEDKIDQAAEENKQENERAKMEAEKREIESKSKVEVEGVK